MIGDPPEGSAACLVQAIGISYFGLASMLWALCIAISLHMAFLRHQPGVERYKVYYHVLVWSISLVLTLLPFSTGSYGDSGGWCWITVKTKGTNSDVVQQNWGTAWRFIQFYIPLWLIIGYNSYVYFSIYKRLRAALTSGSTVASSYRMLARVQYYPLVLTICYFWATINRINEIFGPSIYWLTVLHILGAASQGFWNSIVYGLTPNVATAVKRILYDKVGCKYKWCKVDDTSSSAVPTSPSADSTPLPDEQAALAAETEMVSDVDIIVDPDDFALTQPR